MIKMSMGKQYTSDFVFFSLQIINIRHNIIDTRHVFFRKLNTHIDNDDVIAILKHGHIASNFFLTTKWDNAQSVSANR